MEQTKSLLKTIKVGAEETAQELRALTHWLLFQGT